MNMLARLRAYGFSAVLAFGTICSERAVAQVQVHQLLTNASTSGPIVFPAAGNYLLSLGGTFGGATLTLKAVQASGGTSLNLGSWTSIPSTQPCIVVPTGESLQITVASGSPSGLYATLGGVGSASCTASTGGGGGGGAVTVAGGADVTEGTVGDTQATGTVVGFLKSIWSIFNTNAPATSALQTTGNTSAASTVTNTGTTATALGAPADTAWVSGSGSAIALLKAAIAAIQGTGSIQGVTASGATSTENPIANGCLAKTATPTAVTDGQKVEGLCDALGRSVTSPWSVPANYVSGTGNTTSTGATTIIAAPGASIKLYITSVQCFRTDAGTSLDYAVLDDAASTPIPIPAGTGAAVQFATPLVVTANTALTFAPHAGATTEFCDAQGYKGP